MNWYLSKLVFQIICGQGRHTPQFDEQLRLVRASSDAEAYMRAFALGESEQEQFVSQSQKLVQWKFINVSEIHQMDPYLDGAELYSRIQETDNADLYIEMTHQKAASIRQGVSEPMF